MYVKDNYNSANLTREGYVIASEKKWEEMLNTDDDMAPAEELLYAVRAYKTLLKKVNDLEKESSEKSEWLKAKNEALDNLITAYSKLEKEHNELKKQYCDLDKAHKNLNKELIKAYAENEKLKDEVGGWKQKWEEDEQSHLSDKSKYRNALRVQKELAEKLQNATNDKDITKLTNEIAILRKTARNNENAFKSMKHNYDTLCNQLRKADLDGDVITLPHNGEKIKINQPKVKNVTVSIKEEIDKLAAAGELAGLICTFFGIDDEED